MEKEQENKFSELARRVKITSKARYNASRRLKTKNLLSQWTLTFLSVALIIISLISASDIKVSYSPQYIDIMQIIFSVLILAYSLLLATEDFSARSVKLHRCGMELGRIARELKPLEGKECSDEQYKLFTDKYYDCLEKYENHEHVDFLMNEYNTIQWYSRLEKTNNHILDFYDLFNEFLLKLQMFCKIHIFKHYPNLHYFISTGAVGWWLVKMVTH